ncbi:MAG: 50S ribosomal protein L4 [Candidatus Freyarchaeota archaeon]|nr:50S ribosomal protein L4 [Candidatus Freyrarchaeum guaymaensis]
MSLTRVHVYDLKGEPVKEIEIPKVFLTPFRPDLIKRAVLSILSARRQPYGVDLRAGKRTSAESWGTGYGVARVPRVKGRRHPSAGRAAFVPMAVGGRRTHPPKPEKVFLEKINKREKRLATCSAIAATAKKELVEERGHKLDGVPEFPLVLTDELQKIATAKEFKEVLTVFGLWDDVLRARKRMKKVRAGKGKMRGRRRKRARSVLIVVKEDLGISKAARNYPGVDVVVARNLNVEVLAPGGHPGRLTVWSESAIKMLDELFPLREGILIAHH